MFELPVTVANLSKLVEDATIGEDVGISTGATIKLSLIKGDCLERVVEFLVKYQEEPLTEIALPLGGKMFASIVTQEWYRDFASVETEHLFRLVTAAKYMMIKPLLDLTCLKLAFVSESVHLCVQVIMNYR